MANPLPEYRFNEKAGRFIDSRGRFVSERTINRLLNDILDASADDMIALSKQLQAGTISLDAWFLGMQVEIKNVHLIGEAMAKGGWDAMNQSAYGRVGAIVKKEYAYLRKFAQDISNGSQKLDGRFLSRVRLYSRKAINTYTEQQRKEKEKRGMGEVRSIRHASDSCDKCISQEGLDWISIDSPSFIPIGQRTCRGYCKCSLEYR